MAEILELLKQGFKITIINIQRILKEKSGKHARGDG